MAAKLKKTVVVGEGRFCWEKAERVSDRYGAVHLTDKRQRRLRFGNAPVGANARMVAVVLEAHKSWGMGDIGRGIVPIKPKVGEAVVLGEGVVFVESGCEGDDVIGLRPIKPREHGWLDPEALWRCHWRKVRLELRPVGGAR